MRFAFAVVVAAVAQLAFFLRFAATASSAGYFGFLYIVLATFGAGWFAAKRAALAGALSVVLGAFLDGVVILAGPAGQGMSAPDLALSLASFIVAFGPYIAIGALAGMVGGTLRRRFFGAA